MDAGPSTVVVVAVVYERSINGNLFRSFLTKLQSLKRVHMRRSVTLNVL